MKIKPLVLGSGAFLYSVLSLSAAIADDTEIYVPKDLPADQMVRPNILFILDSSGSMASTVSGTNQSRNAVMKQVVKNLIDQLKTKEDVNIGFMRYKGLRINCVNGNNNCETEQGGHVISPVQRLTQNNANSMKTIVDGIGQDDWTPLSETYYEAFLYMSGQSPYWGSGRSVASSISGGNYISPITHSCQKSHIIYVTDGEPTRDIDSNAAIKSLVTGKNKSYLASSCGNKDGQCLPHLAEYMATQDIFPNPSFSDPTNRKQIINSHFVGFTVDLALLKNSAAAGGGKYYTANNVSGLTDALTAITREITAENTTFAAPSVAVSAFNNLGFRNELYYALFRPSEGTRWPGNVKRYKLDQDDDGNPLIVDKNGNAAIDLSTGFFADSTSSFWSAGDGKDIAKGGVAAQLISPDTRKVFTWTDADRTPQSGSAALNQNRNLVVSSNTQLTSALLGASSSAERDQFINWARGKDLNNNARLAVGDVLHNEPRLVAYTTDEDLNRAGTAGSPEQLYMFFGSNEGFLHAIDPKTGEEKFAFLPKELLSNPGAYLKDSKGSANKRYGMDGNMTVWTEYGDLTASKTRTISKAWLYAGMRRGGSNYYALDVSNIDAPGLKWVIKGPQQNFNGTTYVNATTGFTTGYAKLGQTFSSPKLATIKLNGQNTKVLIFTGGYDLDQDIIGTNTPKNDDIGNALFIANATTGELIWRAGNTGDNDANLQVANMTNSMPADPAVVDISGDGLADIIYASDLRGQVFRFDINNKSNTGPNNLVKGGRIASLAGSAAVSNRRFFSAPDVALIRERGGKTYFTISLGTGFRESPLNTETDDRFYVLRDSNVYSGPSTYTTLTESDLLDVSGINANSTSTAKLLADIDALEAQMAALNKAVADQQAAFVGYKDTAEHTKWQNAAIQSAGDANNAQKQLDEILDSNPYLTDHAVNSTQQSLLQDAVTEAQRALKDIGEELQGTTDPLFAAALIDKLDRLNDEYRRLIALQEQADGDWQTIVDQQNAVLAAKTDPAVPSDQVPALEAALAAATTAYFSSMAVTQRNTLNTDTPTNVQDALNAVSGAADPVNLQQLDDALIALASQLTNAGLPASSGSPSSAALLARDEESKQQLLSNQSSALATTSAKVASLQAQINTLNAQTATSQAKADDIANRLYDPASQLLNATDLAAAKAIYGSDLTIFEAYTYLIDKAIARASDPSTGVPALRTQINNKYAQITPGDTYTPEPLQLAQSKGFYLRLPRGEKVLSTSLSFRGAVFFSTFSPRSQAVSNCGSDVGRGRFYAINLLDASAVYTVTENGTTRPVRSIDLKRSGIPPTPAVVVTGGKPAVIAGTEVIGNECVPGSNVCRSGDAVKATYWREN